MVALCIRMIAIKVDPIHSILVKTFDDIDINTTKPWDYSSNQVRRGWSTMSN